MLRGWGLTRDMLNKLKPLTLNYNFMLYYINSCHFINTVIRIVASGNGNQSVVWLIMNAK